MCRLIGTTAAISRYSADATTDDSSHLDAAFLVDREDRLQQSLPRGSIALLA